MQIYPYAQRVHAVRRKGIVGELRSGAAAGCVYLSNYQWFGTIVREDNHGVDDFWADGVKFYRRSRVDTKRGLRRDAICACREPYCQEGPYKTNLLADSRPGSRA